MKFVKNMFEHAHGPFKSNGTLNIHTCTFHLFFCFTCCSFKPLLITTCCGILELLIIKHCILNLGMKFKVLYEFKIF